jgi:hypothetical protein
VALTTELRNMNRPKVKKGMSSAPNTKGARARGGGRRARHRPRDVQQRAPHAVQALRSLSLSLSLSHTRGAGAPLQPPPLQPPPPTSGTTP